MSNDNKQPVPLGERRGWREIYTPANIVTITRILLVPVFIALMFAPWVDFIPEPLIATILKPWAAAIVFILLAATDGLDGYLARSRGEVTTFGMLLDPLADKILVSAALLVLIELQVLPAWVALIILAREFLVSGLRMVAAAEGKVIAASNLGKAKTVFQIIAVVAFIVKDSLEAIWNLLFGSQLVWIVNAFAWISISLAVLITIVSLVDYFMNSAEVLGFERMGPWARRAAGNEDKTGSAEAAEGEASSAGVEAVEAYESHDSDSYSTEITELATAVLAAARARGITIGTAESCTGGLIAAALTAVPGASDVFKGAVVSYANAVKSELLAVSSDVLAGDGAVSEECVIQMAEGAMNALAVDLVVSVSGIAGPDGGSAEKPVGTVWLAVRSAGGVSTRRELFNGNREAVRRQTVLSALTMLREACTRG